MSKTILMIIIRLLMLSACSPTGTVIIDTVSEDVEEISTNEELKLKIQKKINDFSKKISDESTAVKYFEIYEKTVKL